MNRVQLLPRELAVGRIVHVRVDGIEPTAPFGGFHVPRKEDLIGLQRLNGCDYVADDDAVLGVHIVHCEGWMSRVLIYRAVHCDEKSSFFGDRVPDGL